MRENLSSIYTHFISYTIYTASIPYSTLCYNIHGSIFLALFLQLLLYCKYRLFLLYFLEYPGLEIKEKSGYATGRKDKC